MIGRPKVCIITEDMRASIIDQRSSGMPWNIIAESLNISVKYPPPLYKIFPPIRALMAPHIDWEYGCQNNLLKLKKN